MTGATTTVGSAAGVPKGGVAALVSAGGLAAPDGPASFDITRRDASTANTAPMAAAPITHPALGRSRTTMTVGWSVRGDTLIGASDPGAPAMAIIGLERRTNAGGGVESYVDGDGGHAENGESGRARLGVVVVRTKGGGLTDGRREAAAVAALVAASGGAGGERAGGGAEARGGGALGGRVNDGRTCEDEWRSRDASAIAERHSPATPSATLSSMMRRETLAVTRRGRAVGGASAPRLSTRGGGEADTNDGEGDSTRTRSSSSSSISSPAFFRFENGSKSSQLPFPYP